MDMEKVIKAEKLLQEIFKLGCSARESDQSKTLASSLSKLWPEDRSVDNIVMESMKIFFDLIGTHPELVTESFWEVLKYVPANNIRVNIIVQRLMFMSTVKLKNILYSIILALCCYGEDDRQLKLWANDFLDGLEQARHFTVLTSVSELTIKILLESLTTPIAADTYELTNRILQNGIGWSAFNNIQPDFIIKILEDNKIMNIKRKTLKITIEILLCRFRFALKDEDCESIRKALQKFCDKKLTNNDLKNDALLWFSLDLKYCDIAGLLKCFGGCGRNKVKLRLCEKGHAFCLDCKKILKKCPICNQSFLSSPVPILNQIIYMTEFSCKYSEYGCEIKFSANDSDLDHIQHCKYKTVVCDLQIDSLQECINPKMKCNQIVILKDFKDHAEKCHLQLIIDFKLGQEIRREIIWNTHLQEKKVVLLKDAEQDLLFMERFSSEPFSFPCSKVEKFMLSFHYLGKLNEYPIKFEYSIAFRGHNTQKKFKYCNSCYDCFMIQKDVDGPKETFYCTGGDHSIVDLDDTNYFDLKINVHQNAMMIKEEPVE